VTGTLAAGLVRLVDADAHESPTWFADEGALYVTTTRGAAGTSILRIALDGLLPVGPDAVTVLRADANLANGMAADAAGRLIVCEHGTGTAPARISAVDRATGAATTLVDSYRGRPLISPHDVVVRHDGTIWFTDPAFGAAQGVRDAARLPACVYRFDPRTGVLTVVSTDLDHPYGLAFSPDERMLYVIDSACDRDAGRRGLTRPHLVLAFEVTGDRLGPADLFAEVPRTSVGIVADADGRVFVTGSGGLHEFSATGEPVGLIALPGAVNLTVGPFGLLFVTTDTAVWAAVPGPGKDFHPVTAQARAAARRG
jgi:gluconolactonase